MATQYANGKIVTNGLILSLDAADKNSYPGTGTTWTDLSGNGYDATMSGSVAYSGSLPNSFQYVSGSNNYFLGNSNLTGSIVSGITIISWIKMNDNTQRGIIFNKYTGSGILGYAFEAGTVAGSWTNSLRFYAQGTSGNSNNFIGSSNIVTQNLIFQATVTFNYATKSTAMYINGSAVNASQNGVVASLSSDWYQSNVPYSLGSLRRSGTLADSPMNQYNLIVYNRALSQAEILQNYNAQKSRFNLT
jgi:hypothetical protein